MNSPDMSEVDSLPRELRTHSYHSARGRIKRFRLERRFEQVLEEVARLKREGSRTLELTLDQGDALARLNRPEEALEVLEPVSKHLPPYGQALFGGLLEKAGRTDEARAVFENLAQRAHLQGSVLLRTIVFFQQAREWERAVFLAEHHQAGVTVRAKCLAQAGRTSEALELLTEAQLTDPDPNIPKVLTLLAIDQLSPEEAEAELEALSQLPEYRDDPELAVRLAQLRRKSGHSSTAVTDLRRTLAQRPQDKYLQQQLALALRDQGEFTEALEILEALLRKDPKSHPTRGSFFKTCAEARQKERAESLVRELTSADPGLGSLWGAYRKAFKGFEK